MKIVCIDDDPIFCEIFKSVVTSGCAPEDTLVFAHSGEEGISFVKKQHFDLVITDLLMPGMSGLDVLKQVKEINAATEVIIITGQASIDTAVNAMKSGARDYIVKPVNIAELTEKICTVNDLLERKNEAEDFRLAKEVVEIHAQHTISQCEEKISMLSRALDEIKTALNNNTDATTTVKSIASIVINAGF